MSDLDAAVARLKADVDAFDEAHRLGNATVHWDRVKEKRLVLAELERRGDVEADAIKTINDGTHHYCNRRYDSAFDAFKREQAKAVENHAIASEALAERDAARAEVERLTKLNEDLLTYQELGGTCAYCKATHLKEEMPAHIEQCAKHPMAAMKAELDRLRERGARVRAVLGNPGIDRQTAINRALALLKETP